MPGAESSASAPPPAAAPTHDAEGTIDSGKPVEVVADRAGRTATPEGDTCDLPGEAAAEDSVPAETQAAAPDGYVRDGFYDEMFGSDGRPRRGCRKLVGRLGSMHGGELERYQRQADVAMLELGVTFRVYEQTDSGEEVARDRIFPFDVLPRVIGLDEWRTVEDGLRQRIEALNLFLDDIYNDRRILTDGVVPEELIATSKPFLKECIGLKPPKGIWCHITGTDLVRDAAGQLYVLEDNLRVPSGVSYVLENRTIMKQTMPQFFGGFQIASVEDYPERLLQTLMHAAPAGVYDPQIVVLTPGHFNSAYFEHSYLAQEMGVELVQGSDLVVEDDRVFMQTTQGLQPVHVIYRRIDDVFLDPEVFRRDSLLGVPGLMRAYRAGNVSLANAPGNGVADDKAVYAYVPEIIKYYLGQDPILPNVPTFVCSDPKHRQHVIANIEKMVVKPTNESGGYGLLIGPHATDEERARTIEGVKANPRNFIAQEMLCLSTVPTLIDGRMQPRHVDLRPFILHGAGTYVLPGGLTRVALKEGSIVVNSSQGGGSKDTWVLANDSEVNVELQEDGVAPMVPPGEDVIVPKDAAD